MPRISLSEAATEELDRAYRWYEEQRSGLGGEFLDEFLATVDRIDTNPRLYATIEGPLRRAPLHRFPYSLFYFVQQDAAVVIVAVFHGKRDPLRWQGRR